MYVSHVNTNTFLPPLGCDYTHNCLWMKNSSLIKALQKVIFVHVTLLLWDRFTVSHWQGWIPQINFPDLGNKNDSLSLWGRLGSIFISGDNLWPQNHMMLSAEDPAAARQSVWDALSSWCPPPPPLSCCCRDRMKWFRLGRGGEWY